MWELLTEPKKCALVAGSLVAIYAVYRKMTKDRNQKSFPDFPGVTWRTNHRAIMKTTDSAGQFIKLLNKFSYPAGYIRFRFYKILAVCDLNYAKELFLTHGMASSGRNPGLPLHLDPVASKNGVIFASGESWKTNRRIFLNFLRQWGKEKQLELVLEESRFLLEAIEKMEQEFEPSHLFQSAVCNIISTLIFGSRIEYSDPKIDEVFASILALNQRADYFPTFIMLLMIRFPIFSWVKKRKTAIKTTKDYLRDQILGMMKTGLRDPPETLVEAYALEKTNLADRKDNQELEDLIVLIYELFFAGTETTSTTLQWALACLSVHPEIQQKMFEEIDSVVGDAELSSRHLKNLPYTTAVQLEVQRFGSIAQSLIPHIMLDDVSLSSGYKVRKGETALVSLFWILRDKTHWKHPDSFCPEHFLDEDGNVTTNKAFVPYGIGPRVCLGQHLADLELKVFMIELVRRFKIVSTDQVDLTKVVHKITCGPKLYNYKFLPR